MIKEINAVPYSLTRGFDDFHDFINQEFNHNILIDENIFKVWIMKDMVSYYKYQNNIGIVLEFYADKYSVKSNNIETKLPIPETIDIFLHDMNRLGVEILWSEHIVKKYSPKNVLNVNEIHKYYFELLTRMGKEKEIVPIN